VLWLSHWDANTPLPHVLLAQGAANEWLPAPDVVPAPGLDTKRKLVAEHLHKMNGSTSPGLDIVAPLF